MHQVNRTNCKNCGGTLNEITINPTCIEATRLYDGTMNIVRGHEQVELTLISYGE